MALKHDFIRCVDFSRRPITASQTATDDVTN